MAGDAGTATLCATVHKVCGGKGGRQARRCGVKKKRQLADDYVKKCIKRAGKVPGRVESFVY